MITKLSILRTLLIEVSVSRNQDLFLLQVLRMLLLLNWTSNKEVDHKSNAVQSE